MFDGFKLSTIDSVYIQFLQNIHFTELDKLWLKKYTLSEKSGKYQTSATQRIVKQHVHFLKQPGHLPLSHSILLHFFHSRHQMLLAT